MTPPPEPLESGWPDLHYFLLGDNAFALMPWKKTAPGRENCQLQDIQGQEGGRKCFWNISGKVLGTADHHGA